MSILSFFIHERPILGAGVAGVVFHDTDLATKVGKELWSWLLLWVQYFNCNWLEQELGLKSQQCAYLADVKST